MNTQLINGVLIDWAKISEQSYLRNINAISGINHIPFDHSVTFFVGENGSGKSTLLEAIAVAYGFNPEGGTRNYNFSTYDSHSELCDAITLSRGARRSGWGYFLRAESFYNVATKEEEYSRGPGGVPQHFHEKSHGESFLALAQNSFRPNGLYLLDEPEAALSPSKLLELMCHIHTLEKQDSQFIISTHSPILMAYPNAQILYLTQEGISVVSYQETEHYQVTKQFLNAPEQMCKYLFSDELS